MKVGVRHGGGGGYGKPLKNECSVISCPNKYSNAGVCMCSRGTGMGPVRGNYKTY